MPAEEASAHLARRLLAAAKEDLTLGRRALESPALPNGAVFHAQQAMEKALKGFLAWHGLPSKPTHDLTQLVSICTSVQNDFTRLEEAGLRLTPYATAGRYPDVAGGLTATLGQAQDALREAAGALDFVLERLPTEARP